MGVGEDTLIGLVMAVTFFVLGVAVGMVLLTLREWTRSRRR